jgi:hypothetical protein
MSEASPHEGDSDAPGVVERLARDDVERKRFLKMAGSRMGAGAAATALGAFIAACGSSSSSSTSSAASGAGAASSSASTTMSSSNGASPDLAIVNYALTLEYIESDFYDKVVASGLFKGSQLDLLKAIQDHEHQHVTALTGAAMKLGGQPAAKPKTQFPLKSARSVAKLAATVENLGAAAYLGQAAKIKSPEILAAALSIHSVEARHAAALNTLIGKDPAPDGAFAVPASMADVLPKVKPFIVG